MEKVLVVGSGGREHALLWKLSQSPRRPQLHAAPGHDGLAGLAELHSETAADDLPGLVKLATELAAHLVVIGPEAPLCLGLADRLQEAGFKVFGPTARAARLEGSKVFAKNLMRQYKLPTAAYEVFHEYQPALAYLDRAPYPLVIKADGLAAGKGVIICQNRAEAGEALRRIMQDREFGDSGNQVVVEEFLEGEEVSALAWVDGEVVIPMPSAQDHKPVFDGDRGPNTGGMGAYSPAPLVTPELEREILETVLKPAARALIAEGCPFSGVLYAGLMITAAGPKLLEFNVRFGDPEAEPLLMRLKTDLLEIMLATAEHRLAGQAIDWDERPALGVVLAAPGYPGPIEKGAPIKGLEEAARRPGVMIFLAGVKKRRRLTSASDPLADAGFLTYQGPGSLKTEETLVTNGGRVLVATALGADLKEAAARAYEAARLISWPGAHYRRDIGRKALVRLGLAD